MYGLGDRRPDWYCLWCYFWYCLWCYLGGHGPGWYCLWCYFRYCLWFDMQRLAI